MRLAGQGVIAGTLDGGGDDGGSVHGAIRYYCTPAARKPGVSRFPRWFLHFDLGKRAAQESRVNAGLNAPPHQIRYSPAGSTPAAIRAAHPVTARRAPAAPTAARGLVDDGGVCGLRIQARSALSLCIGDGHRSNNKDRGSQSHGNFTHQILLLSGGVGGVRETGGKPWLRASA
jgi:hypothetical protein